MAALQTTRVDQRDAIAKLRQLHPGHKPTPVNQSDATANGCPIRLRWCSPLSLTNAAGRARPERLCRR